MRRLYCVSHATKLARLEAFILNDPVTLWFNRSPDSAIAYRESERLIHEP